MSTMDSVAKISEPAFYTRVHFLALITAQQIVSEAPETPNHIERIAYARHIFMGRENAPLLAAHVVASNSTIQTTIEDGTEPPDADIQFALASIWDARALAL